MTVSSENTIGPIGSHPQVHIIVAADAPSDASAIQKLFRRYGRQNQDITQESWVEVVQVYNVFGLFPGLLEELNMTMAKNIEHRATVIRRKLRHNDGEGVMVGEGEILDQHGNVGPWRNMGPLPDSVKYVIEEESADVLDIWLAVLLSDSHGGASAGHAAVVPILFSP